MGWLRRTENLDDGIGTIPTSATPEVALARFTDRDSGAAVAELWRRRASDRRAAWRAELDSDVVRLREGVDTGPPTVIDLNALGRRLDLDLVAEELLAGLGPCAHDLRNEATARCMRCRQSFCDDCLVRPLGVDRDPFCVECAVDVAQMTRRSSRRFHLR